MRDGSRFPDGFVWGAATASYQIEGAVREGGRGPSIWDVFSATPGKTHGGDTGEIAADHYHRWHQDVALLRELGVPACRFSVAWPRVIPDGVGKVNAAGLDFYDRLVDALLDAGVAPWVTLYHWDLPQALGSEGGLRHRDIAGAFGEYAEAVARRLGDRVEHWITVDDPWSAAVLGYGRGVHAPGETGRASGLAAAHNLLRMHGTAVDVLRANVAGARVGIAVSLTPVQPVRDDEADADAARRADGERNRWFLDAIVHGAYPDDMTRTFDTDLPEIGEGDMALISRPIDLLGVAYAGSVWVSADPEAPRPDGERTAAGTVIEPNALERLLRHVHEAYAPAAIAITGAGAAFDDPAPIDGRVHDPRRVAWLHDHLHAAQAAIDAGVPLEGWFVRSLLDGFEWAEGYSQRFGIVHVDHHTQERTPKDSARWYANVIAANSVLDELATD